MLEGNISPATAILGATALSQFNETPFKSEKFIIGMRRIAAKHKEPCQINVSTDGVLFCFMNVSPAVREDMETIFSPDNFDGKVHISSTIGTYATYNPCACSNNEASWLTINAFKERMESLGINELDN